MMKNGNLCIVILVRTASNRNKHLRPNFYEAVTVPVLHYMLMMTIDDDDDPYGEDDP